jgi:hypothetical protein
MNGFRPSDRTLYELGYKKGSYSKMNVGLTKAQCRLNSKQSKASLPGKRGDGGAFASFFLEDVVGINERELLPRTKLFLLSFHHTGIKDLIRMDKSNIDDLAMVYEIEKLKETLVG